MAVCRIQTDVALDSLPLQGKCHFIFWVENQIKLGFGIQFDNVVECLLCDKCILDIVSVNAHLL